MKVMQEKYQRSNGDKMKQFIINTLIVISIYAICIMMVTIFNINDKSLILSIGLIAGLNALTLSNYLNCK